MLRQNWLCMEVVPVVGDVKFIEVSAGKNNHLKEVPKKAGNYYLREIKAEEEKQLKGWPEDK